MAIDRAFKDLKEIYPPNDLSHEELVDLYQERDRLMPGARMRGARVGSHVPSRVLEIENQVVAANMRLVIKIAKTICQFWGWS